MEVNKPVLSTRSSNVEQGTPHCAATKIVNFDKALSAAPCSSATNPKGLSELLTPRSARTPRTPRGLLGTSSKEPGTVFHTPTSKLHQPSPEPTINSLRVVNVALQRRVAREEDIKKQLKAELTRNLEEQQKLNERIKTTQSKLRQSLEQQSALHGTVRELLDDRKAQTAREQEHEREIQRLKSRITDMKMQDRTLRKRLQELDMGSASTKQHARRVASTIAAIQVQDSKAREADNRVSELQQKLHEARVKSSSPGGPANRETIQKLLGELNSATRLQHKAHAKIKQLEGQAETLRQEVVSREDELNATKHELEQARSNAEKLASEYKNLEHLHQDQVDSLREQQLTLTAQCKVAEDKVQSLSFGISELQQRLEDMSEAKAALHSQLDQAVQQDAQHVQQMQELQQRLEELATDREAAHAAAEAVKQELRETETKLKLAQEAAKVGTPRGEAAKEVLKRSLVKIRDLQGDLADAQRRSAEAAAALKTAECDKEEISNAHKEEIARLHAALDAARQHVHKLQDEFTAELTALRSARAHGEQEIEELKSKLVDSMQREQHQQATLATLRSDITSLVNDRNMLSLEKIQLESDLHDTEQELSEAQEAEEELREALREHMRGSMTLKQQADAKEAELVEVIASLELKVADAAVVVEMQKQALEEAEEQVAMLRQHLKEVEVAHASAAEQYARNTAVLQHQVAEAVAEKQQVVEQLAAKVHHELHLQRQLQCTAALSAEQAAAADVTRQQAAARVEELQQVLLEHVEQLAAKVHLQMHLEQQLQALADHAELLRLRGEQQSAQAALAIAALDAAIAEQMQQVADAFAQTASLEAALADASAEKEQLEGKKAELEEDLAASHDHIAGLQLQLEAAVNDLAAVQEQLQCALTTNDDLQDRLAGGAESFDALQQQLDDSAARFEYLHQQLNAATAHNKALQAQLSCAHEKCGMLESRVTDLEEELRAARASGTPKGEGAKVVLPMALQKLKTAQTSVQELEDTKQSLQARLDAALQEKDAQHIKATAVIADLEDRRQAQVERLKQQVAAAEQQLAASEAKQQALMVSLQAAEAGQTELGAQLQQAEENQAAAIKALHLELEAAKGEAAKLQAQLQQLQEQLQALTSHNATLVALAAADQEDKLILHEQLNSLRAEVAGVNAQLATAQAQNEDLRAELMEARQEGTPKGNGAKQVLPMAFTKIRGLQEALEQLQDDKRMVEAQATSLAAELTATQQELNTARSQLYRVAEEASKLQETLRDADIAGANQQLQQTSSQSIEGQLRAAQAAIGSLTEEREMLMHEVQTLQVSRKRGTPRGEGAKILVERYQSMLDSAKDELKDLQGKLREQEDKAATQQAHWQGREQELLQRCVALAAEVDTLQQRQADEQVLADIEFEELHSQLQAELQATSKDKAAIAAENAKLLTEVRTLQQTLSLLQYEAESKGSDVTELEEQNQQLMQQRQALEKQVTRLQHTIVEMESVVGNSQQQMEQQVQVLQHEANNLRDKVQQLQEGLQASQEEGKHAEAEYNRLVKEMEELRASITAQQDSTAGVQGTFASSPPPRAAACTPVPAKRDAAYLHDHDAYLAAALDNLLDNSWCFSLV